MNSRRRLFVAVMGAWMGLAGIEHGVGEVLQGNVPVEGIMILSWPDSAFFRSLSGEPAMTILPNMLLTGIVAILVSLVFAVWAIFFVQRRHGGLILMLLAVPMLLFGGGIFPPVLGGLVGAAAGGLDRTVPAHPVSDAGARLSRLIGRGWPWIFAACCMAWLALLPGVAVLDYFFGVDNEAVTLTIMSAAFALLFLAYWSSRQSDRLAN